ncbi:hypothetical protein SAMN05443661_103117 [Natronobacterium gregoryi]|uniref:Uncharacterized protein n=2 Tax=Natronobacterium gregoryi TaxID=44930 RepID=L0AGJ6_NATGS|nr:hypothetical protein Natgr_1751 [Natronobacterium gregoryi SP2]ELY69906.1 hypothetical protein C490_07144 [Natronobacterium gregoryi SP2]PLK21829.1 hypothetical protein CYV19_01645 [Natronobacterium gregoryi SP2]SFI68246.1 hypothetical protein SAMN05443661_103117 [Natronobacterium gregoryi]
MNPRRVDAIIDLGYGVLIFVSVALIVSVGTLVGVAFGLGVLISYALHVVWKMARFDPDWMSQAVKETVGEQVEKRVDETVSEQLDAGQEQLETVDQRIDRRPRSKRSTHYSRKQ